MNEEKSVLPGTKRSMWGQRRLVRGLATLGVVAGVATGTWAVEESAKSANEGLRGLFASTAPADLNADEFAKLGGAWSPWSAGAAAAVSDFYAKLDTADAVGQRAALNLLKAKLDVMKRAIDDPKYTSIIEPLVLLHGRLAQRIDLAEAALDTLELDPAKVKATKRAAQAKDLTNAIANLRADLNRIQGGSAWLPYVKGDAVEKALSSDPASEATVSIVRAAKDKFAGIDKLADAQKKFLSGQAFVDYDAALGRFLEADAWQPPSADANAVRAQLKALLDAVDSYAESRSADDAAKIRGAYSEVSKVALDGGDRMSAALQKHVLNFNVRIIASEEFLDRLMADSRVENGPVIDNILGVPVSGNQTTNTRVTVNLLPSPNKARFDLTLTGTIQSSTVGTAEQANVYTQGYHTFVAEKEVTFDGKNFTTMPATINVNPHNTTTGIDTRVGFPFRGIAQGIASREVEARRGTTEAIAADRVRSNVLPKFNAEADKSFADAGPKLEKDVFAGLRATGLFPDAYLYQTTDTVLRMNSRLMGDKEAGGSMPHAVIRPSAGATVLLHESAANNSINRMGLGGQTLTEPQLRAKLEEFFSKALSREVKFADPKDQPKPAEEKEDEDKGPKAIIFDEKDPMRVGFDNGELTLYMKAAFKQDEGKEDIPTRDIVVPINVAVQGNKILLTRGDISVSAADGGGGGIAINGVVRKKLQSSLPDRRVDSKVNLKGANKQTITAHVVSIGFVDGWAVVWVK